MMDRNKREEVQTEATYQTLSEFLQSTPPNQWRHISDLSMPRNAGSFPSFSGGINTPELELHCSDDSCKGVRFFRCTGVFSSTGTYLEVSNINYLYVTYQCANCQKTQKVYSLSAILFKSEEYRGTCCKLGEFPPYGPPLPPRLIKLIGPDKDIFIKGRNCENQGFGIGAFTYY